MSCHLVLSFGFILLSMLSMTVFGDSSVDPKTSLTMSFRDLQESPLDKEELLIHARRTAALG